MRKGAEFVKEWMEKNCQFLVLQPDDGFKPVLPAFMKHLSGLNITGQT